MELFYIPASCVEESSYSTSRRIRYGQSFISAILIGVYCYLIAFPVVSDIEHLCMCLFALCVPSLGMCLLKSFIIELWESFDRFRYKSSVRYMIYKDFLLVHSLSLYSLKSVLKKKFWFLWSSLYWFVLLWIILLGKLLPNCPKIQKVSYGYYFSSRYYSFRFYI